MFLVLSNYVHNDLVVCSYSHLIGMCYSLVYGKTIYCSFIGVYVGHSLLLQAFSALLYGTKFWRGKFRCAWWFSTRQSNYTHQILHWNKWQLHSDECMAIRPTSNIQGFSICQNFQPCSIVYASDSESILNNYICI